MRIKVFGSGKYIPQGEFSEERVKKIFSDPEKEVKAIFLHSSMYPEKFEPLELGTFKGYEFKRKGDELEVYSNLELNEIGKRFYTEGVFKGVSAELPNDELTKIAILPNAINQAVKGAEFSAQPICFEFREGEIENKDLGGEKKMEREEVLRSLTEAEIKAAAAKLKLEVKAMEPDKTEAEIKAAAKAEIEGEGKVKEFMEKNKLKIVPALQGCIQKLAEEAVKSDATFEFNKKDTSVFEGLCKFMEDVPDSELQNNYSKDIEFSDVKTSGSKSPFQQGQIAMEGVK